MQNMKSNTTIMKERLSPNLLEDLRRQVQKKKVFGFELLLKTLVTKKLPIKCILTVDVSRLKSTIPSQKAKIVTL